MSRRTDVRMLLFWMRLRLPRPVPEVRVCDSSRNGTRRRNVIDVPATLGKWTESPCYLKDDRWFGPPGHMIVAEESSGMKHFIIACPQCGEMGAPRDGQVWRVTKGVITDASSLTLRPSIQKHCCGWHGWLTDGKFTETPPSDG